MTSNRSRVLLSISLGALFTITSRALSAEPLKLEKSITLPGVKGGFDLMTADVAGQRLFVNAEDNGTTEVIDLKAGVRSTSITGMHEPKWAVFRPEMKKIYIASGDGQLRIFDSETYQPCGIIRFKEKTNNLRYDETTAELFVGVGNTFGSIAIVDAKTDKAHTEIPLENFPKQFELDGDRIYVNVPTANHIAVISRSKKAVIASWPVTEAKGNIPMALDRKRHRLFVGCEPGRFVVFDTETGKSVANLAIAPEPDGVSYDAKRGMIYISCGEGSLDVLHQTDADHYEFTARIPTVKGAATSIFTPELDRLFLAVPAHDDKPAEVRIYQP